MTLTIELPDKLNATLQAQARAQGISAAGFARQVLEQVLTPYTENPTLPPELPILHLGAMDALHRCDIYNDVG